MPLDFLLFVAVGFLGMAYGVLSMTVLLAFGVAPANASASVHVAELFTTFASGARISGIATWISACYGV